MSTAVSNTSNADLYASLNGNSSKKAASDSTASADRFLTMLVTQLQNQDPLNPMDNAQLTSQMAQINAVTGLEKVNESVKSLNTQLLQMQALQGAALVGRNVTLDGNTVAVNDGVGRGSMLLEGSATTVKVEVLDGAKQVVGTVDLGSRAAGLHNFEWNLGNRSVSEAYTFRVAASNGATAVTISPLMLDRVQSVSNSGDTLTLSLARTGVVPSSAVVSYN